MRLKVLLLINFGLSFIKAMQPALDPATSHGAFLDTCGTQHCQTSSNGWNFVTIKDEKTEHIATAADSIARWYLDGSVEKWADGSMPDNPTCLVD